MTTNATFFSTFGETGTPAAVRATTNGAEKLSAANALPSNPARVIAT